MKVGVGVVRELLRRIVCLEWCKSAVYEVRYAREVEKGYKRGTGRETVNFTCTVFNYSTMCSPLYSTAFLSFFLAHNICHALIATQPTSTTSPPIDHLQQQFIRIMANPTSSVGPCSFHTFGRCNLSHLPLLPFR